MFRRRANGQASLDNLVEMIHLTHRPPTTDAPGRSRMRLNAGT